MKRKICVLTGTRADYGLLYWLMHEIRNDSRCELQLIVTGMHLSPDFGLTYKLIEQDGFQINEKIDILRFGDSPVGLAQAMGVCVAETASALQRLKPDLFVVLGDRYEALAAAQAAMLCQIPIAHLHGGEATEGLIDEAIRHSITKMSHLHFVAADVYRKRVIQLGEQPDKVFNVGATGIDNIKRLKLFSDEEILQKLPLLHNHTGPVFLVTYHPVTLSAESPRDSMQKVLQALDQFPEAKIIITKANADTYGHAINELIDQYADKHKDRVYATASLGQKLYLSVMRKCDVVIGNSSSGIVEAPAMKKPTINIGPRQNGRAKADSIIDCPETVNEIQKSIAKALTPAFKKTVAESTQVYGEGNTAKVIKDHLVEAKLDGILLKKFYNLTEVAGV